MVARRARGGRLDVAAQGPDGPLALEGQAEARRLIARVSERPEVPLDAVGEDEVHAAEVEEEVPQRGAVPEGAEEHEGRELERVERERVPVGGERGPQELQDVLVREEPQEQREGVRATLAVAGADGLARADEVQALEERVARAAELPVDDLRGATVRHVRLVRRAIVDRSVLGKWMRSLDRVRPKHSC